MPRAETYSLPAPVADGAHQAKGTRPSDAAHEVSDEAMHDRVLSACRRAGKIKDEAFTLLVESRSADNGEMWVTVVTKTLPKDHAAVSATTAAVVVSRQRRKCFPMSPGRRVRIPGALRRHRLPQRSIGPRRRRSTLHAPPTPHPHQNWARGNWQRHDSLLADNRRQSS